MRSLEKLKEFAKPALDHAELIAIARTASSNTEAKNRALEFTKKQGLDEQVAMSCRWLKMFRDQINVREFETYISKLSKEAEVKTETAPMSKTRIMNEFIKLAREHGGQTKKSCEILESLNLDLDRIENITGLEFSLPLLEGFGLPFRSNRIEGLVGNIGIYPLQMNGAEPYVNFQLSVHEQIDLQNSLDLFGCSGELKEVRYSDGPTTSYATFDVASPIGCRYVIQLSKGLLSVYVMGKDIMPQFTSAHFSIDQLDTL